MLAQILMHESFEAPAAFVNWLEQKDFTIRYTRFYLGEALPKDTSDIDFLIIMGGPQSPSTTKNECAHFDAKSEIDFIAEVIKKDKLVLGVCLGAQLIGEALGARYEHSPNREIGVYNIYLTDAAKRDPLFKNFPDVFPVGHWHGDMPGIAEGAEVLAYSEGCPRQIVRYSSKVYGFQCHFEFNSSSIEAMIENCGSEIIDNKNLPYIQTVQQLRLNNYEIINKLLFKFLDGFTGLDKTN